MGMCIKTFIAPDEYGGRGLFADQPIAKGDIVWRFEPHLTEIFSIDEYKVRIAPGDQVARDLIKYSYPCEFFEDGVLQRYIYNDIDNGKHMNHSSHANTGMIEDPAHPHYADRDYLNIALRDIAPGEQLTYDYFSFVTDIKDWLDVETCMQFLIDAARQREAQLAAHQDHPAGQSLHPQG